MTAPIYTGTGATKDEARAQIDAADVSTSPAIVMTERGDIIYRNATVPTALHHGTAGQLLTTGGHGADPSWATLTSDGHGALSYQNTALALLHPAAVAGVSAGFMSSADKTKLDALPTVNAFMGDGSDGAAAFTAAGAAVTGATHEGGGVYRLNRDVNYTTVTIENGAVVKCSGSGGSFFLRASTSITNLGVIHADGLAGANAGAGGGAGGAAGTVGTYRSGTAGGNGNNAGAGAAGGADVSGLGAVGGAGGAGGNDGGANGGGAAGVVTAPTAVMGDWRNAWAALQSFLPGYNAGTLAFPQGGSGGGGGGSGLANVGTTSNGGGGGAGGGILKIAAPIITNSGTGVIRAAGGAGGNGNAGSAGNDDGGGGGGGGGGGLVLIFRTTFTGNAATAPGGAASTGGAPSGTGAAGGPGLVGTAGTVIHFTV
jgi:hypothetical protein